MKSSQENLNTLLTYKDYLEWPEGERIELIYGKSYNMSPAPSPIHQRVVTELSRLIGNFLQEKKNVQKGAKKCEVFVAPFDVILSEKDSPEDKKDTVVQPDILLVCDLSKIDNKGLNGPPAIAIEVVSPYTAIKDLNIKMRLYEKFKVLEYWIIQPNEKIILFYKLKDNAYGSAEVLSYNSLLESSVLSGFHLTLNDLFEY